jgi:amidase
MSRAIVEALIARFDLLVTPTMACLPPPVGAWRQGTEADPLMALLNCYPLAVFTSLCNVTGLPAISIPIHHDEATGLPVGVQIVAAPWREDLLLRVAHHLECVHPWAQRRPPVS